MQSVINVLHPDKFPAGHPRSVGSSVSRILSALDNDAGVFPGGQLQKSSHIYPAPQGADDVRAALQAEMESMRHMILELQGAQRTRAAAPDLADDDLEVTALKAEMESMRNTIRELQNLERSRPAGSGSIQRAETSGDLTGSARSLPAMVVNNDLPYTTVEMQNAMQHKAGVERMSSSFRVAAAASTARVRPESQKEVLKQQQTQQGGIIDESTGDQIAPTKTSLGLGMLGTVVDKIVPSGPADRSGTLVVGDCIIEVDGVAAKEDNIGVLLVGDDVDKTLVRITTRTPIGEIRFSHSRLHKDARRKAEHALFLLGWGWIWVFSLQEEVFSILTSSLCPDSLMLNSRHEVFRALRPDIQLLALQQALPESGEPSGGEQVSPELAARENDSASSMPPDKDIAELFERLDANSDGKITMIEFIKGLRSDRELALRLQLPTHIHQEDESRQIFQHAFGDIDVDLSKDISREEFLSYYRQPGRLLPASTGTAIVTSEVAQIISNEGTNSLAARTVMLQDREVVGENGTAGQDIRQPSSSFAELIVSKADDTKVQQLKNEVLQTKQQHQLDLERMDKFMKSERQLFESEIRALKDQVKGAEEVDRSIQSKDLVQLQQLQQEEIVRLKQMHKGEIERIQNESKELQQLHMHEVAQMDRLEALVTSLREENAVLRDEARGHEDSQETLRYKFAEERRQLLLDQRGLEIEVQRLEKIARDTSGLGAVQALSDEFEIVDAQFETFENRHKLAMESFVRKYNKDLGQIRADLDFANSRNDLLKKQNEKLLVHEKQVSRLTQGHAQLEKALAAANEEMKQQEELVAQQKQLVRELEDQVRKMSDRLKEAHAYNDELEMQLVQGPSKAESQKLKASLEAQLQSLAGKLKETQSHGRELEEHLAANERERKSLSATLKKVQQYNHELETAAEESIRARNSGESSSARMHVSPLSCSNNSCRANVSDIVCLLRECPAISSPRLA